MRKGNEMKRFNIWSFLIILALLGASLVFHGTYGKWKDEHELKHQAFSAWCKQTGNVNNLTFKEWEADRWLNKKDWTEEP